MFTLCNVKCEHEFYSHFVKCEHGFLFHSFPIIVVFNNVNFLVIRALFVKSFGRNYSLLNHQTKKKNSEHDQ